MAQMETNPPDITNSCEERNRLSLEIKALDIVINLCTELVNFPDTDDNHEMKAILRASIDDTQRKKDTMVSELRSLPPSMTFNCNGNYCTPTPPIPTEKHKDSDSNHILKNYSEAPTNANNAKNKKKKEKRKINKKDSVEDFVFPKKIARPVSSLPSDPVTENNSFSDLESENDKDQVAPEENNETVPPKPKPPPPIHLKIKKNIRDQLKSIYQKFPDINNKSSGEFIKLITNDIEEYHAFTNFLEEEKDFKFFSLKPKLIKPIKIVIKGLPIFTKTHEIQFDLEEGFTIENVSQLISKKTKTALPFFPSHPPPQCQ
ncbi:uncharacterized protein TNCV_770251 [Trichonephila clavipes]|nr:uncharacterized protein TNCV_770251 [Trichonephila clavipes]